MRIKKTALLCMALLLAICSVLTACSSKSTYRANNVLHIDELIIRNTTRTTIRDIELNVVDTRVHIACSVIFPQSMCSLGFQEIPLEEHETYLSWTQYKTGYSERVKASLIPSMPSAKVYIDILDKGKLKVSVK